jgi:colanic acid/amylovoran biosynthesis glycosyltransferase
VTRVAYLNTRYPRISHTFIEREIRALRARGLEVHTFSIRRPEQEDLLGERNEEASRTTTYLLELGRMARSLVRSLIRRPWALVRTAVEGQRLSPPGLRPRLLHCAYALEGTALAWSLRDRGLRHVHVHIANNGAAVALLATVFDRSLSYSLTIHGSEEFFDVKGYSLRRKVEAARFVRCISNFCRAQVMAWSPPDAWPRLHVVHCGLDPADFPSRRPRAEDGILRVITVGRLDPIKGYDVLLEACRRLTAEGTALQLRMIGNGPERGRLEALVRSLGLAEHVEVLGALGQEALQHQYDWADVMVVSSFMEGIPVVLMEAMAKELAVVATRVAGIPELVDDGVSGLLAVPGSDQDLANLLRRLARDGSARSRLGAKARDRIAEQYSIADVSGQVAELLVRYVGEDCASGDAEGIPERQSA